MKKTILAALFASLLIGCGDSGGNKPAEIPKEFAPLPKNGPVGGDSVGGNKKGGDLVAPVKP